MKLKKYKNMLGQLLALSILMTGSPSQLTMCENW